MYSLAYAWIYSQNGATTGAIATIHVNPRLDVIGGVTLGVNSLYDFRGRAPSYIARGLYYVQVINDASLLNNNRRREKLTQQPNAGFRARTESIALSPYSELARMTRRFAKVGSIF